MIKRYERLTREQWERALFEIGPEIAMAAGLYYVDYRMGIGIIDDNSRCVWTRQGRRVTITYDEGRPVAAKIGKTPDPRRQWDRASGKTR